MASLSSMQMEVDGWIKQHPFGYFDADGLCKKSEEEIGEAKLAVHKLISEKRELNNSIGTHIPASKNLAIENCRKELALELGDILFALCCLSNKYEFALEKPYYSFVKYRSTKLEKFLDHVVYTITGKHRLLPPDGRSKYPGDYPDIKESYSELFKRLQFDADILRTFVIPNEELLMHPPIGKEATVQKIRNNILGCLMLFLHDLVRLSHKDLFDLESCFAATMEKNNKRAENNYKKEKK
ncbi:MAG: hypothetical protein NT085_02375 [candidate division SR1 bacterium]|nr:hypothetical protein [candidate division SR1 bacterium]